MCLEFNCFGHDFEHHSEYLTKLKQSNSQRSYNFSPGFVKTTNKQPQLNTDFKDLDEVCSEAPFLHLRGALVRGLHYSVHRNP